MPKEKIDFFFYIFLKTFKVKRAGARAPRYVHAIMNLTSQMNWKFSPDHFSSKTIENPANIDRVRAPDLNFEIENSELF